MTRVALTIAGSDSGGGAGIQADLKTFSALGVYGASVITALTAQNTQGVAAIHDVPATFVRAQMDAVFSDINVHAVKIGMLASADVIAAVAEGLEAWSGAPVVLDPVMVATSGDALLQDAAVEALKEKLLPRADLLTPNLHEAARLLGLDHLAASREEMEAQGEAILDMGAKAVLVKGGHAFDTTAQKNELSECADLLICRDHRQWFTSPRIETKNTHGTGCTLSSAIAAGLAKGLQLSDAVFEAKSYISAAIQAADQLGIGKGHGPVHHFHAVWERDNA